MRALKATGSFLLLSFSCWSMPVMTAAGEATPTDPKEDITSSRRVARVGSDARFQAGATAAPVVLSIYASGRSTGCARLVPALYAAIYSGRLEGKVRLEYRPFGAGSAVDEACSRAMVAAADQGLFWPYLLNLYRKQDELQPALVMKWAYATGVDRGAFDMAYDSPATSSLLAEIEREGRDNGVKEVPAAFIDGRRIGCELTFDALVSLLEQEYDRMTREPANAPHAAHD